MGVTVEIRGLNDLRMYGKETIKKIVVVGANELKNELIQNTPIDSGKLANNWILGDYKNDGNKYYIDVLNTAKRYRIKDSWQHYGSFPNYGFYHVKAKKFIQGQHFLEKSEFNISNRINNIIKGVIK